MTSPVRSVATDANARVDAELRRSVQQIRRRETVEDVTNLIKGLLSPKHRDRAAFLLDGRMYLGSTALPFSSKPFYTTALRAEVRGEVCRVEGVN